MGYVRVKVARITILKFALEIFFRCGEIRQARRKVEADLSASNLKLYRTNLPVLFMILFLGLRGFVVLDESC